MAKRSAESDGLKGYLHNVSGISSSAAGKTRYFVGQLQMSKTDVKKVVVFSPEKHDTYMKASVLQSPVKITGGKLSPGKNEQLDILVGKGATLEVLTEPLMFKKQKIETSAMSEPKNLDSLNKEGLNVSFITFACSSLKHGSRVYTVIWPFHLISEKRGDDGVF